jgi:transposase
MNRKHTDDQRNVLIELVGSKGATIKEAAVRVGVSYSTATRWVHQTRTRALVASKPAPKFAQLVRENERSATIQVRVGCVEITVRRGFDVELLRTLVHALGGATA